MSNLKRIWRALPALVVAVAGASAAPALAQAPQPARIEIPVHSTAPDASLVKESYVSLYAPLPAADGPHPAACDRIGYLRFRDADGPANPARADAVFVAQPGFYEGAGAFDQVARNTIRAAAERGYYVEFWALDRRSQCLENTFGIDAAAAARNPQLAFDYYYEGKPIDGQTFPGFVTEQDAAWLSHVGLAQTMQDEYTVISQLPPAFRKTRVLCGGHSLGGIFTGVFANWDFSGDGNPAMAGYNQCAGYFLLDTRLTHTLTTSTLSSAMGGSLSSLLQLVSNGAPYLDFPPFTPETSAVVPILGLAAYDYPNEKSSIVPELPNDFNFNFTLDALFSGSWSDFLTDTPDIRDFNLTNQAVVGFLFGSVSEPIGILRSAVGAPAGGPVVEKNFPVAYGSPSDGGVIGGIDQVVPAPSSATPNGPLYGWLNYNQIPTPGPAPADDPTQPYTSSAAQVSDITQLDRTLFEAPALFTEDYFPDRLIVDLVAEALGDRSGDLANERYSDGDTERPAVYVDGGNGVTPYIGSLGAIPDGPAPQVHVVAPYYDHLDVLTAAWQQNDGQPEITSSTLASWMSDVVGAPR